MRKSKISINQGYYLEGLKYNVYDIAIELIRNNIVVFGIDNDAKIYIADKNKNIIEYNPDGNSYLHKNIDIDFEVIGGKVFSDSSKIYWQVVNTGEEAKNANCLRGGFESSNLSHFGRHESTSYTGTHWVQAFLVKDNKCIGKSKEILVRIL